MKKVTSTIAVANIASTLVAIILVLIPFHAFLTVWLASIFGHYTALRLWKEVLLIILAALAAWLVLREGKLRRAMLKSWLWRLVGLYVAVQAIWGVVALALDAASTKAVFYGLIVNVRLLLFLWVVWVVASVTKALWSRRYVLLFGPAVVVVVFGILQRFVLPYDALKHFGYGPDTIRPYQTIDKKTSYFRIISTLRGANPLGAYLAVIIGVLSALLLRVQRRWLTVAALAGAGVVLAASQSRSAWIGALLAVMTVALIGLGRRHLKIIVLVSGVLLVVAAGGLFALRDNDFVQNTFFHTDENSQADTSSNSDHISASVDALKEVATEPLGRGTGTAGPASRYNSGHESRIAENYFLQVGQETGWLGLGLFVAICAVVGRRLYLLRADPLALGLLAALVGVSFVNLLSHAWTDDTIAYIWWGFAGLTLARPKHER